SYELKQLIDQTYDNGNPTYYRLSDHEHDIEIKVEFGKGQILKSAQSQNTVITAGPILRNVVEACKDLDLNILYFPTIKPLDTELLNQFKDHNLMVIHEAYGLLEAAQSAFPASRFAARTMRDSFVNSYGNLEQIRGDLGFDARSLREFLTQNMIS
ncbi:MAG: hypothetical protein R3261_13355, partial [Alphaproteobacteria bacterium]|nr:hypothetical protein [Alphaproteobacteria bacterium]